MAEDPEEILEEMNILKYFNIASQEKLLQNMFVGSADEAATQKTIGALEAVKALSGMAGIGGEAVQGAMDTQIADLQDQLIQPDIKKISKILMNLNDGAMSTPGILNDETLNAIEGLQNIYKVYYEPQTPGAGAKFFKSSAAGVREIVTAGPDESINSTPGSPLSPNSGLSLHTIQFPMISPAARHASSVEFFMNGIPPQEFSRCVPHIDLIIRTQGAKGTSGMNMMRFLGAEYSTDTDTVAGKIATAIPEVYVDKALEISSLPGTSAGAGIGVAQWAGVVGSDKGEADAIDELLNDSAYTTMDIFTMPQSMVDYSNPSDLHPVTGEQILDRSRPFMSMKGMTVSHQSQRNATIYTVQVKVDLVLHDRSRLADIAPLIAPRVYKTTEFLLEYGWSHPDGSPASDNVYGRFLESMRHRGVFFLVRSDYTFTQDGQVEVSIILQNASSEKFKNYTIAEGKQIDVQAVIENLQTVINQTRSENMGEQLTADALPVAVFKSESVTDASMMLPVSLYSQINQQINALTAEGSEASYEEILETLNGLLSNSNPPSDEDARSMFSILDTKIQNLKREPSNIFLDPFLKIPSTADMDYEVISRDFTNRSQYVSFGKLVLSLIGHPIAASQDYDEVQLFFHGLNHAAGAFWGENIASFPIKLELLEDKLKSKYQKSRRINVGDLFDFCAEFLETPTALPYGVSRSVQATQAEESEAPAANADADADDVQVTNRELDDFLFTRIRNLGCPVAGEFITPSIGFIIDVLNASARPGGADSVTTPSAKIMRIHVVDTRQTPHLSHNLLLRSLSSSRVALNNRHQSPSGDDDPAVIQTVAGKVNVDVRSALASHANFLTDEAGGIDVISPTVNHANARRAVSDAVPTFKYGINTSGILSLDVRGSTSGPIADALIMQALIEEQRSDSDSAEEEGQGSDRSIPADTQLVPATVTLNTIGCPLLAFGQQYFLSMGTGTTLEQVYGITRLVHTLRAGEFKSSATLYPVNSGRTVDPMTSIRTLRRLIRDEVEESRNTPAPDPEVPADASD